MFAGREAATSHEEVIFVGEDRHGHVGVSGVLEGREEWRTFVTGATDSANFPTESPIQGNLPGPSAGFVARIGEPEGVSAVDSPFESTWDDSLGLSVTASF